MQQNNSKSLVALKLDLNDPNHKVRMQAARELCRKNSVEAVDAIVSRLEQEKLPAVRKVVSRSLIKMDLVHVLVSLSRSKIDFERNLTVQWLQRYGRRHIEELLALLKGQESLCSDTLELVVTMSVDFAGARASEFVKYALEDSRQELVVAGARMARLLKLDGVMPTLASVFERWCDKTEVEEMRHILNKLSIDQEDVEELAEFERKLIQAFNALSNASAKPQQITGAGERRNSLTGSQGEQLG